MASTRSPSFGRGGSRSAGAPPGRAAGGSRGGKGGRARATARPIVWELAGEKGRSRLPTRLDGVVHLAAPRNRWLAGGARLASHIRISVDAAARGFDEARLGGGTKGGDVPA